MRDFGIILAVLGTGAGVASFIYTIVRNLKKDFDEKFERLDNRIFQLAMGKSLKEIMLEEKGEK